MLEDNHADVDLIARVLKKNNIDFEYSVVDTKEEFEKGIDQFHPDAIFSDHSLPQFHSLEAFKIYKEKKLNIPFILITGLLSEELAVKSLKEGVDDYIFKDLIFRLPHALNNALRKRKLAEEKAKLENQQCLYLEQIKNQNLELIKINQELDRFLYTTSHELKGPVTSVLGLIYLIQLEISEGRYENLDEYLSLVELCIKKLLHTFEELMDYSFNKNSEIEIEPINIIDLLEAVWLKLSPMADIGKVKNRVDVHQSIPFNSDKRRISLIIENLLRNGIKFRDKSRKDSFVSIKVNVMADNALIIIEDNGIGIEDIYLHKVFQMFFRGTEISEGPGLGLYLVKESIDKLKGSIMVESKVNVGTKFTITIPNIPN
jgi:hypothetical protein